MGTLFTLQFAAPDKFAVTVFSVSHYLSAEASVAAHNVTIFDGISFSVTFPSNSSFRSILFISFAMIW